MKAGIHPDYHEITVTFTDGTSFKTRSVYGKPGDNIQLDVDPKTHPAWVGGVHMKKTGQMEKFANKFGNIAMAGAIPGNNADAAAKKEEKKD